MEESTYQFVGKKGANVFLNERPVKFRLRKHAHEVALASALEVASKTVLLFGRTVVVVVFHAIRFAVSSGSSVAVLDSIETQLGNFFSGL